MTETLAAPVSTDLLKDIVKAALKAGADAAEAVSADRRSLSVGVRNGKLEDVEREESRDLGLRVFVGRRQASVSASDLSPATQARLVERAVAMARLAPEDPHAGFAPEDRLARGPFIDLDLFDPSERSAQTLEQVSAEAEAAALAVPGVARSEGGHAGWSSSRWQLVTSHGFDGAYEGSAFSLGVGVIAEKDGAMERGGESRSTRHLSDLPGADLIGGTAGERAAARVGPRKIASTTAPVIFDNRMAGQIVSPAIGAISGPSIARGTSFLKERLGQRVFAEGVTLIDDPFRPRGMGSTPFDDEGAMVQKRALFDDGVLTTWLLNSASARQLGLETTGHASRGLAGPSGVSTHNLHMEPGERDLAGLMADAGTGLLVTSMFGPSLNGNTGDWSAGVSGFWFENGVIAYPVSEVTVAGKLTDLYLRIQRGSDLEFRGGFNVPSLMFDAVAIAGK
ncbi:MAG: PmbA protein [Brevundimonas sp.]|jgi:PmbA protein|uniref:TldD/PmbA family protein n=1 Tax=Brevundimonas sp. GW460-12-10-14-LB2 TaxID=1827469 RepID=UPI0007BC8775|nr:TldD/PmbA family protein [Brevundimonas sp. GW460-12-10-14-LB2]ANC53813.1 modulator protein [Brevundimonas sp. GW460-12-10-14-LB2]MEA3472983.1 TldD/PmbA family protein [Pseudomonadota bacterium]